MTSVLKNIKVCLRSNGATDNVNIVGSVVFLTKHCIQYTKYQAKENDIMKKKIIALIAALAMTTVAFTGCSTSGGDTKTENNTTSSAKDDISKEDDPYATGFEGVYEGKHFVVGISVNYPNFEELDIDSNEIVGLDIDILNYMSEDLGFTYEISDMKLPQIVAALQIGEVDLAISGMYETEERTEVIDMSDSYLTAKSAMLIRKDDADTIKSTDDLNGKTVCCNLGEVYYESVIRTIDGANVTEFDDTAASIQAVLGGQADARIIDGGSAKEIVEEYPDLTYFMLDDSMIDGIDSNHYSMGFPKDSEMTEVFNAEIEKMKNNGKLKEIIEKWLGEGMYDFD